MQPDVRVSARAQEAYGDEGNYTLERLANNRVARMMAYGPREAYPGPAPPP